MKYFLSNNFKKNISILMAFIIFSNHLICTTLYLIPENSLTKFYKIYVWAYMEPVFIQRWHLFAPEPRIWQTRIYFRCQTNGMWSGWIDPAAAEIIKHRATRMSYHGKMVFALSPSSKLFRQISQDQISLNYNSAEMREMKTLAHWLCRNNSPSAQFSEFKLEYKILKDFSLRQLDEIKDPVWEFIFPTSRI